MRANAFQFLDIINGLYTGIESGIKGKNIQSPHNIITKSGSEKEVPYF